MNFDLKDHELNIISTVNAFAIEELQRANETYPNFQEPYGAIGVLNEEISEAMEEIISIGTLIKEIAELAPSMKGFPHQLTEEERERLQRIIHQSQFAVLELVQVMAMAEKYILSFSGGGQ